MAETNFLTAQDLDFEPTPPTKTQINVTKQPEAGVFR
jgi:hypothetical protein